MNAAYNVKKLIVGTLLSGGIGLAGLGLSAGTAQAFNPQPEPPGRPAVVVPDYQSGGHGKTPDYQSGGHGHARAADDWEARV
ncbi:hypothetical protein [Mycolicibacterium sp. CBMA 226]|uniref:hypothetical protein n=1 Tax=Mycolicibacterium sp. CBMA 226 TaxID=2606611 RepID=UPI0012DC89DF|nr:hypothetical protein [Mycolicibacterium sp. CBMA 226]MUL76435.1 hypothetical protein [Mycolicibacterium sp. CBMA 226]